MAKKGPKKKAGKKGAKKGARKPPAPPVAARPAPRPRRRGAKIATTVAVTAAVITLALAVRGGCRSSVNPALERLKTSSVAQEKAAYEELSKLENMHPDLAKFIRRNPDLAHVVFQRELSHLKAAFKREKGKSMEEHLAQFMPETVGTTRKAAGPRDVRIGKILEETVVVHKGRRKTTTTRASNVFFRLEPHEHLALLIMSRVPELRGQMIPYLESLMKADARAGSFFKGPKTPYIPPTPPAKKAAKKKAVKKEAPKRVRVPGKKPGRGGVIEFMGMRLPVRMPAKKEAKKAPAKKGGKKAGKKK